MIVLYTIIIFIMVVLSACFSGTEAAYNSANNMHLRREAEETGSSSAKLAYKISQNFADTLCTILIGNNLVNISLATISVTFFHQLLTNGNIVELVSTLVSTVVVLIFGEITPKTIAKQQSL